MNKSQAYQTMQSLLPQALTVPVSESLSYQAEKSASSLHFSGYDPRAAGGRQTLKLELRAELDRAIQELRFEFRSELLLPQTSQQTLQRSPSGAWQAVLLSFSSKGKEHGQYPLDVQLSYLDASGCQRLWVCTTTILIPRANASLSEIHQVFLASQKNVRVHAEDGAIAKLGGLSGMQESQHRQLNIDIYAKDAAIAQWEVATGQREDASAPLAMGLSSIAWDENLVEVAVPTYQNLLGAPAAVAKPTLQPTIMLTSARLVPLADQLSNIPTNIPTNIPIQLLVRREWTLGRQTTKVTADIVLHHLSSERRISAQHAIIRRSLGGVQIIDSSRYGTLLNSVILEKHQPMPLLSGMQIELCANFKGLVQLRVLHILPHALILGRLQPGAAQERLLEIYYLLTPDLRPEASLSAPVIAGGKLPLLFHAQGQFYAHDPVTMEDTNLMHFSSDIASTKPGFSYRFEYA
ncbi:FHA domain-containing protein [Undibacterium flavidum]|uniref:FHA domain-containing protein n=1 Tax=Undibacterium flavidum TaxID=2762297 RepID=A0ABR6YAB0_9BURK|nr:FHA domain-containing protein [Undibacterium flavidum]MBC3873127.1 FHA domain-containing protein [Undibacterium flavidum]